MKTGLVPSGIYLPKKTDLTNLTNKDLEKIEFQINNRPMKCLDWMTPVEFMHGEKLHWEIVDRQKISDVENELTEKI
jgi:hypothetical protein